MGRDRLLISILISVSVLLCALARELATWWRFLTLTSVLERPVTFALDLVFSTLTTTDFKLKLFLLSASTSVGRCCFLLCPFAESVIHVHRVSLYFDLTLSIKAHHISSESNSYMLRVNASTEWYSW